jgi:hypothetical protein
MAGQSAIWLIKASLFEYADHGYWLDWADPNA